MYATCANTMDKWYSHQHHLKKEKKIFYPPVLKYLISFFNQLTWHISSSLKVLIQDFECKFWARPRNNFKIVHNNKACFHFVIPHFTLLLQATFLCFKTNPRVYYICQSSQSTFKKETWCWWWWMDGLLQRFFCTPLPFYIGIRRVVNI